MPITPASQAVKVFLEERTIMEYTMEDLVAAMEGVVDDQELDFFLQWLMTLSIFQRNTVVVVELVEMETEAVMELVRQYL